ncbi:MAG TPA: response regulator [Dehalococcoidia bacterium]|nr:response regulator [Dehalococcoidia bacterium]
MAKVLVVEDVPDIRFLLVETLVDAGHEALESGDGVEGLASARQHRPDVILLDVMMPVMDGLQMLEALKADSSLASIPVIMVSAKGQEQDVKKALRLGATAFVVKPWAHNEVESQITRALAAR